MSSLVLRDLRDPTTAMPSLALKIPASLLADLDRFAAARHTSRSTLIRSLLIDGLERHAGLELR